jgi:hypothetical protein
MTVNQILTHPGGAHKDDFLACSILVHLHQAPIVRREPAQADLDDPATLIIDVGGEHEPARGNFDHHQFPKDHPPVCALSLVLQHIGLYDDARLFCDWLEPAEWFDCLGPIETAQKLGVDRDVMNKLNSPIDVTLLRRFAATTELSPGDPLWEIMRFIGEDLVVYLETLHHRLEYIKDHADFWTIDGPHGPFEVIFMPRTDPLPDEPSMGLPRFIEAAGKNETVLGMFYPDRRGDGYGLSRHNDSPLLDFSDLEQHDDVHFAHNRGFIAKTSATDPARLRELLTQARQAAS